METESIVVGLQHSLITDMIDNDTRLYQTQRGADAKDGNGREAGEAHV